MVSFTDIARAISENDEQMFTVKSCIVKHQASIDRFTIASTDKAVGKVMPVYTALPRPTSPVMRQTAVVETVETVSDHSSTNSDTMDEVQEFIPLPCLRPVKSVSESSVHPTVSHIVPPTIVQSLPVPQPVLQVQQVQQLKQQTVQQESGSVVLRAQKRSVDPTCVGIQERDAMYDIASFSVRQSMEAEEARILESKLGELYKNESGRSRGWTKTHLEAYLVPRAASGGSVPPKQVFDWSKIFTDKTTSATLDYVCLAKGIRIAVWKEEDKSVGIWPAADLSSGKTNPPLYHVTASGVPISNNPSVLTSGWKVRSAYSVEHGLEKLSLDELESLGEKLGISVSGKKAERVQQIASERTKQRLR
jgi:hypothetical protein